MSSGDPSGHGNGAAGGGLAVAAYLKVGKRTVYRLAAAKKIPAFKVGGTWRFSRQEIDQWIKRQTAEAQGGDASGGPHDENE